MAEYHAHVQTKVAAEVAKLKHEFKDNKELFLVQKAQLVKSVMLECAERKDFNERFVKRL